MKRALSAFVSTALCLSCLAPAGAALSPTPALAATSVQSKVAEQLDRGLVATAATSGVNDGIYLSWRLLADEPVNNQAYDVYRNGTKIATTGRTAPTTFVDSQGTNSDTYQVVKAGEAYQAGADVAVWTNVGTGSASSSLHNNIVNSYAYLDVNFDRPPNDSVPEVQTADDGTKSVTYTEATYTANDASAADLNGDGDYEIVLRWEPSNCSDNGTVRVTSPTILDAYDIDYSTGAVNRLWRINLGYNVRSGAHYNPFIVYDLDQDGKAELAVKTAPGSLDGQGNYVSDAGDTAQIRTTDNSLTYYNRYEEVNGEQIPTRGNLMGGPEYLTLFNGETGAAMVTTDYWAPSDIISDWGDDYGNRRERYLASVAYLDGQTPSLIMHRGYYRESFAAAYQFDGTSLNRIWTHSSMSDGSSVTYANGTTKTCDKTLYGQGFHNLSVADVDNDGFDEVIYGSAVLDHDGTVLTSSGRGHGDALHVSDFDNDGNIEMFEVHESSKTYSVDLRRYDTQADKEVDLALRPFPGNDVGRGIMDNFDDAYAQTHPDASAIFWTSTEDGAFDTKGNELATKADTSGNFINYAIYWDGDLSRELLDGTKIAKYSVDGPRRRFMFGSLSYCPGVNDNNSTKRTPCLQADLLGDWREEIVYRKSDGSGLRIFMSTIPTSYRIPTLMSDRVYRLGIAWQNSGYNQPPHTGYYLGSAALAHDTDGNPLSFLNPVIPTGTLDEESTSSQVATVVVPVLRDTYLTGDGVAHGQEDSMIANSATYVTGGSPGLKDPTSVAYFTFDASKYLDTSKYEIETARARINYKSASNSSSQLYVGIGAVTSYNEATFCKSDVTFRGSNTTFARPFKSSWIAAMGAYQPYEFDAIAALQQAPDGLLSLYCFTGTARSAEIATKEGDASLAPALVLSVKAKETSDPLNTLPVVETPHWKSADVPAAHAHTLEHHEAVTAACTTEGSVEFWRCTECGRRFTSSDATTEISAADTAVPALGHSWGAWEVVREATETEPGEERRTCARDYGHVETREVPAKGGDEPESQESPASPTSPASPATAASPAMPATVVSPESQASPGAPASPGGAEDPATPDQAGQPTSSDYPRWTWENGAWRWAVSASERAVGWIWDGADWYWLDGTGAAVSGWIWENGVWYYLNERDDGRRCAMETGWVQWAGGWYWLNPNGDAGPRGQMWRSSWVLDRGDWYLLNQDGRMQIGWQWVGDGWYWLDPTSGRLLANTRTPDGSWIDENGRWVG